MTMTIPEHCDRCKLMGEQHESKLDCIEGLRAAIKKQNEVSKQIATVVLTRMFTVLEDLSRDPTVNAVQYTARLPDGSVKVLHGSQVSGVMAAIFTRFEEMGDWSPMTMVQEELRAEQAQNKRFEETLERVTKALKSRNFPGDQALIEEAKKLLYPDQYSEAPQGPPVPRGE